MPEDVEKQLTPQEIADLFAFLCLDKPPADPAAKPLPARAQSCGGPDDDHVGNHFSIPRPKRSAPSSKPVSGATTMFS